MRCPPAGRLVHTGNLVAGLTACIVLLAASPAAAQGGGWQFQVPAFDLSLNYMTDASALDANHVWVIGAAYYGGTACVLRSSDGGSNWAEACPTDLTGPTRLKMVSSTTGWFAGYGPYTCNGSPCGQVRMTTDGGQTWVPDNAFIPNGPVYGMTATSDQHVWTAGYLDAGNLGTIYHRKPSPSVTWTREWTASTPSSVSGISAVNSTVVWAVGSGLILKTTDGGAHWNTLTLPSGSGYGSYTYYYDVAAIDANTAWIISEDLVFETTDGGVTWPLKMRMSSSGSVKRITAINANVAWAIGTDNNNFPVIYYTADGGTTWKHQPPGTKSTLYGITAVDANNAWVSADYGVILHTTDGGTGKWVAPTVTSVVPNHGPATSDANLTITGTDFRYPVSLTIGSTTLSPSGSGSYLTFVNGTTIQADFYGYGQPPGTYDVTVTNGDGQTGTLARGYTEDPPPTVTSVSPPYGSIAGGYTITVTGANFASGAQVFLQGIYSYPQPTTFVNATTLQATIGATQPDGSSPWVPGAVSVTVQNPDLQSNSSAPTFTFADPTVFQYLAITPTSGPDRGGTPVTISGYAFQSGATVLFGGVPATNIVVVNANTITATTPAHAAGAVNVTGQLGNANTTLSGFTFVATPSVTSVVPNGGTTAGGTLITVHGANFVTGASLTVGGVAATGVSVTNATTLTATTPAHAAGSAELVVTNPDTNFSLPFAGFTYADPPVFSDNPLSARATTVRGVHVIELRQAVATLRARYALTAATWTDASLTSGTTPVKAVHVSELRAALAGVYAAAARTPPTYTDPVLSAGHTAISGVHVTELRAAIAAIW